MNLSVMSDGSERIGYEDPKVPIYVRKGDLKSMSNMAALCHWHEDVELLMPLKGYLRYNVEGKVVTVQEGNAIFVNTRHMHYGFSADGTDCEYICITFRPQILCGCEEIGNRYVMPVLNSPSLSHLVLRKNDPEHSVLLSAIHRIWALYRQQPEGYELQVMGHLFAFWQGLYTAARNQLGERDTSDGNLMALKRMLEFVRTHFADRISVDAIAAAGGVCRTKCCQLFKTYLNQTPNDYVNSFRLEKGMELLKSTDLTVTEIAGICGFSGASYFTELFTRRKGITPTAFRKG